MQSIEATLVEFRNGVENTKVSDLLEKVLSNLNIEVAIERVIAQWRKS